MVGPAFESRSGRGSLTSLGARRMNPQGEGGAFAPIRRDDEHQGDEHLRTVHAGARAPVPPLYGSGRPAFSPLPSYADAAGSSLHQRGENPAPR